MNKSKLYISLLLLISVFITAFSLCKENTDTLFATYIANPKDGKMAMHYKNENNQRFGSIKNIDQWFKNKNKTLAFAMNGGMYKPDHSPLGLYIENGKTISALDTSNAAGNFYLKPNGVFFITSNNKAGISKTEDFLYNGKTKYATQSGPMLIINGIMHPAFKEGSQNTQIRNGVGILRDGKVLFAISKRPINLYDFANYFKEKGCENALYLDGFVSRAYIPSQNHTQADGDFGVIITVTK